jgi:hypothetical protein
MPRLVDGAVLVEDALQPLHLARQRPLRCAGDVQQVRQRRAVTQQSHALPVGPRLPLEVQVGGPERSGDRQVGVRAAGVGAHPQRQPQEALGAAAVAKQDDGIVGEQQRRDQVATDGRLHRVAQADGGTTTAHRIDHPPGCDLKQH